MSSLRHTALMAFVAQGILIMPSLSSRVAWHAKKVPVIAWSSSNPFLETVVADGKPVILRHTMVDEWSAHTKWTDAHLGSLISSVNGAYVQRRSPVFGPYHDPGRPLAALAQVRPLHNYTTVSMDMRSFLTRIQRCPIEHPEYTYLTTGIAQLHPTLEADLEPLEELLRLNPAETSVNVWWGQKGVIAPCHYDGHHNTYVQIRGTKRFLLASPRSHKAFRMFPFLHPSHAQCQTRLTEASAELVADLQPGDLLYLPPLWLHEVEAQSTSLSVNVWTPSQEIPVVNELFQLQPHSRTPAAIVHALVSLVFGWMGYSDKDKTVTFFKELYEERYEMLHEQGILPAPHAVCPAHISTQLKDLKGSSGVFVAQGVSILARLSEATVSTWMGNYAEGLAFAASEGRGAQAAGLIRQLPDCAVKLTEAGV